MTTLFSTLWRSVLRAALIWAALSLNLLPLQAHAQAHLQVPVAPEVAARAYLLLDVTANQILASRELDMPVEPASLTKLMTAYLVFDALKSKKIDMKQALAWPQDPWQGDTIWMGCIDSEGRTASFIQSVFWEFGSGVVCPSTGVMWQNRGISFSLKEDALHRLEPGRKPFHTLNPAMARFKDGRSMVYGTMGGEGQPQTQAAVFSRYALFNQPLQTAVTAPRWLLGRTWGEQSTTLKLESRFDAQLVAQLRDAGHVLEVLPEAFSDTMGHAGAVVRHPNGMMEGAADPRSDGSVACV